jgi:hypothetical protein
MSRTSQHRTGFSSIRNERQKHHAPWLQHEIALLTEEHADMKITQEERERLDTELMRRDDAFLGGLVMAVLAVIVGATALVLIVR